MVGLVIRANLATGIFSTGGGSGASIFGGILTINGSNFGVKSPAAPVYYNNFNNNNNGDNYAAAGFDFRSDATSFIDASVQSGVHSAFAPGHKYWRNHWGGGNYQSGPSTDPFHQTGKYMPGTLKCHCSYAQRIILVSGPAWPSGGAEGQWKGPRCGHNFSGTSSSTSGNDLYNSTDAKIWSEHFDDLNPGNNSGSDNVRYRDIPDTVGDQYAPLGTHTPLDDQQWHRIDDFCSMNSVGFSDGVRHHYIDGQLRLSRTDQHPRTQSAQNIGFCIPNPGMTNGYLGSGEGRVVDGLMSNILIDSCFACVGLINQASFSGAIPYYLPAITWNDGQVTAACDTNLIPPGYNRAFVMDENRNVQVFLIT